MFKVEEVSNVYSGRKGCACGCRGKYSYASAHKAERPSYCEGDEWVSDRSVKAMVKKVEAMLADPNSDVESVMVAEDGHWVAVDMYHDRTYTVYFAGHR